MLKKMVAATKVVLKVLYRLLVLLIKVAVVGSIIVLLTVNVLVADRNAEDLSTTMKIQQQIAYSQSLLSYAVDELVKTNRNLKLQVVNNQLKTTESLVLINKSILTLHKQPSFDYLRSVSIIIETSEGSASGVIFKITNDYTYIITNDHVVSNKEGDIVDTIEVVDNTTKGFKAEVVKRSNIVDLAVIKIVGQIANKIPIKDIAIPFITEPVFTIGFSARRPYLYGAGYYAGHYTSGDVFQLPTMPGCSGSGIFNSSGELVGLRCSHSYSTLRDRVVDDIANSHAVPAIQIKSFIQEIGIGDTRNEK